MTFMLVLTGAVLAALILSGRARTMTANDWIALAILLLGVNLIRGGNLVTGGALVAAAALWRGRDFIRTSIAGPKAEPQRRDFETDRARALLGVEEGASIAVINDAWRQRLAEHHPDRGGDEEMARQINRARDLLVGQIKTQSAE